MYLLTKGFLKWARHSFETSVLNKLPTTTCNVKGFEATIEKKSSSDFEELKAKTSLPDNLSVESYYEVKLHNLNTNKNYQKKTKPLTFIFMDASKVQEGAENNGITNWQSPGFKWISIDFSEKEKEIGEPAIWITSKEKSVSFDRRGYTTNTYGSSSCCLTRGIEPFLLTL